MKKLVVLCIRRYQQTETALHARCRFEPTCSEFMILAIEKYGLVKGLLVGFKRLLRCRPPHGGIDYP
ncbi:membrane protein insertion efficiency factor YidD [Pseudodesulfovibrio indicus]|uniref:membrane protein insertion efficiency factor YidD n=1 Tax=Pseudodesulfovibrio indicus TaxID=1716143 RepID=UPI00098FD734|nr:membrane protein insertion efficiency factor YidD [Pseudodesulfovibrio indicus]